MRKNIIYALFLRLINITLSFFPVWDFYSSAIEKSDYTTYYEIEKYKYTHNINAGLKIVIRVNEKEVSEEKIVVTKNGGYFRMSGQQINGIYDIESCYNNGPKNLYGNDYYIFCPKGKTHVYFVSYDIDGNCYELIPENFVEKDDWELKCFWDLDKNLLFIGYLQNEMNLYRYNLKDYQFQGNKIIEGGIYDLKWKNDSNYQKQFFSLLKSSDKSINKLVLNELNFNIGQSSGFDYSVLVSRNIINMKNYTHAYFDYYKNHFYWMTYNDAFDFDSGYYIGDEELTNENLYKIDISNNTNNSPFEYIDNITIKELKMIPNTKYAYYKIFNENKKKTNFGMIDITLNKIIFNTDLELKYFKPFSNNSMLAYVGQKFFMICAIKGENNSCIDECENGENVIHNVNQANICNKNNDCSGGTIKLIPNNICINSCDQKYYHLNGNECGLCKDFFPSEKPYKMVNIEGCLSSKPEKSYFINEKQLLLACSGELKYKDGECLKIICYDKCKTCYGESTNNNDQKCLNCKDNFVLQGENCKTECLDGYYEYNDKENGRKCEKCDDGCKRCKISPGNCFECEKGYFHQETENACLKCSKYCETCSEGPNDDVHNCLTCDQKGIYKYLYNASCWENCPEPTILKNNKCVPKEDNNNNKENGNEDNLNNTTKNNAFLGIFIGIFSIILLTIMICFFRKNCCKTNGGCDNNKNDLCKELL